MAILLRKQESLILLPNSEGDISHLGLTPMLEKYHQQIESHVDNLAAYYGHAMVCPIGNCSLQFMYWYAMTHWSSRLYFGLTN